MLKKKSITYRAIKKTPITNQKFENFEVFHLVHLQYLVQKSGIIGGFVDVFGRQPWWKLFCVECWSIKIIVCMEPRIPEKIIVTFVLVF